jgi:DNA-binding transcriptional ArsR family regulator
VGSSLDDANVTRLLMPRVDTGQTSLRKDGVRRQPVSVDLRVVVADQATDDAWAALADGTRRQIFRRLAGGPMAVGELAHGLPVSRPAVSQHLKVLKCAGLVTDRAVGRQRVYQVKPDGVAALRSELEMFWGKALDAYKLIVDEGGHAG